MKLSAKQEMAIYNAVHSKILDLRIALAQGEVKGASNHKLDFLLAQAGRDAAEAAVKAAKDE